MLYYESDAGITELIPFGDVNADEVLCIDSVGSVWGVLNLQLLKYQIKCIDF